MRSQPLNFLALLPTLLASMAFLPSAHAQGQPARQLAREIDVRPIGPTESQVEAKIAALLERPDVKSKLHGHRYRVLASATEARGAFWIQVYDYTNDQLLTFSEGIDNLSAKGAARKPSDIEPNWGEYLAAVKILERDPRYSTALAMGLLRPYEAMPPVIEPAAIGSRSRDRIIPIGLKPLSSSQRHEIVGVNLSRETVHRFSKGSPPSAIATAQVCGPPTANQNPTQRGVPGSAEIAIRRGNEVIWKFTVVRPSSSSGQKGSAIELANVMYRNHLVFARVHIPILNVNYDEDRCGPYRDWAFAENPFKAQGQLLAPGILKVSSQPATIFETNDDTGNFQGVTVYDSGNEVILTSELSADWYRYVSQFRFTDDGTIQPRFKFSAVDNSCVCNAHDHHVYWRFDFDVDGAGGNTIQTWDGRKWVTAPTEQKQLRDSAHRAWRIFNSRTGYGYLLAPGALDGTANRYAVGDIWLLRYKDNEIDDSRVRTSTQAGLDAFIDREPLPGTDVVMWYAGHSRHDHDDLTHTDSSGVVGPTLKPLAPTLPGPLSGP